MKNIILSATGALTLTAMSAMAQTSAVTIHIEGLASDQGTLFVGLCTEPGWENLQCRNIKLKPSIQTLSHQWMDVPPGQYGVTLWHDANDSGKMDFDFFGAPTEQWGSSNNPPPRMGRSLWKDVMFEHGTDAQTLQIKMQPEVN